jgi:hypothetical protein
MLNLRKKPCPKCGKKGLYHPEHPDARTRKNYDYVMCHYCLSTFKVVPQDDAMKDVTDK